MASSKERQKTGTGKGKSFTRRNFLKMIGATSLTAGLFGGVSFGAKLSKLQVVENPFKYPYRGWESFYRNQWEWDHVARSTHSVNCTGSCSWLVYSKDGIIIREEQAADYELVQRGMPDYNPRGCNKGACYSVEYIYGDRRIKYPLIRAGKRGEGKWRRISWEEAGDIFAEKLLENIKKHGFDSVFYFTVIPAMSLISFVSGARFAHITGGVLMSFYDWYSDLPPGSPITFGIQTDVPESADWINAKYIILWGSNVSVTRIPDAHYVWEAKYRGAKVAAIFPDYNPTARQADIFISVKPGTDMAMILAVIHEIIKNKLYDKDYIKEQTDLPILVNTKTKRFLRESDLKEGGSDKVFYHYDLNKDKIVPINMKTLKLNGVNPALEGEFTIKLKDGSETNVKPVFQILKERLEEYTPEYAEKITGVSSKVIRDFAKDVGKTARESGGKVMVIHGNGINQWFNNDLNNRGIILLLALLGAIGKNGGGFAHYVGQEKIWPAPGFFYLLAKDGMPKDLKGPKHQRFQNTTLWSYVHAEVPEMPSSQLAREKIPKSVREYIYESVKRWESGDHTWQRLYPRGAVDENYVKTGKPAKDPKVMIIWRANYLNQAKGFSYVKDTLWDKLDFIVDLNFRMDTTALNADLVLPAATHYEKWDINCTDLTSFLIPFSPAVPPLYESKTDWKIWDFLARKVSEKAKEMGLGPMRDEEFGIYRDLKKTHEIFTNKGKISDDRKAIEVILKHAPQTKGISYSNTIQRPQRFKTSGRHWTGYLKKGVPYTAFTKMTEGKKPYPTLVKRQQFYIDQEWFLEMGEELPVYRPPLSEYKDKYPLRFVTPHGRWSIHSTWRDTPTLLRLQRFRPVVCMNPKDAMERNIKDNDWIRVYNENGAFVAKAYITGRLKPGQVLMNHGWETYMDLLKGGFQSVAPIRIKPTQLAGGYGQLHFKLNYWGPTGVQKDTVVQIEKYDV